jgi:hypothetical protein
LEDCGISGKILKAVKLLYTSISAYVRITGHLTEWFEVRSGLRQGCSLSPIVFNVFINDLAVKIRALELGIDIGGEKVCIRLYADAVVLLADKEEDLQAMLHAYTLCAKLITHTDLPASV